MFFCLGFNVGLHGVIFVGGVRACGDGLVGYTGRDRGLSVGVLLHGVLSAGVSRFSTKSRWKSSSEIWNTMVLPFYSFFGALVFESHQSIKEFRCISEMSPLAWKN